MKTIKILAISVLATFAMASVSYAATDETTQTSADNAVTVLTSDNGALAGSALLNLYNQYKKDGKLDVTNAATMENMWKLSLNIINLAKQIDNQPFLAGLISGSQNLVNDVNSASVLSALSSLSSLDLSSLSKAAASSAATTAIKNGASKLLSKMLGKASESYIATPKSDEDTNAATALLSELFAGLTM